MKNMKNFRETLTALIKQKVVIVFGIVCNVRNILVQRLKKNFFQRMSLDLNGHKKGKESESQQRISEIV